MNYWILKTEPSTYSFDNLEKDKKTRWDGVRNYQARNNLRAMAVGDLGIIYHSGDEKAAVGVAKVLKGAYKDPTSEEDWAAVDLAPLRKLKVPVSLAAMKSDGVLKNMGLVKNSRLSVCPITKAEYDIILKLGS